MARTLRRVAALSAALSLPLAGALVTTVAVGTAGASAPITVNTAVLPGNPVDSLCSLDEAILSANTNAAVGGCTTGTSGADTIGFSITTPHTFAPTAAFTISESLTVDGPTASAADIVLDGSSAHRLFLLTTGAPLTLQDLTVQHGTDGGSGGAINASTGGAITATNVVFQNNSAVGGGAIATGNAVTVTDSTFTNNDAGGAGGGAISGGLNLITIVNTDFSGSDSSDVGGAVNTSGDVDISGDADFTNNTAASAGAGVLAGGTVTVSGTSDFTNNDVTNGTGGGIQASTVTVTGGADFTDNDANGGNGQGGCISAGTITVTAGGNGSTFTHNTAGQGAGCLGQSTVNVTGAVFKGNVGSTNRGGAIQTNVSLTVTSSTFGGPNVADHNTASGEGGAIDVFNGPATITGSTFQGNASSTGGGAIGVTSGGTGTLTITSSTFDGNTSPGSTGGGAIAVFDKTLSVSSSTFTANTTGGDGGAISMLSGASGTVTNSTFQGNTVSGGSSHGSALDLGGGAGATLTVQDVTVADNNGPAGSGAVERLSGTLTMQRSIVSNTTGGGANCAGTITDGGFNLEGTAPGDSCPNGVIPDADPQLSALAANAPGTTQTMLPALTSAAVDAVTSGCPPPATDQRGVTRPQGPRCDVGAVELEDGLFTSIVPARILDTRGATGGHPGALVAGPPFNLHVVGHDGVPANNVSAVVMNITAVSPTATSWITAWPAGVTMPLAASVNFGAGQTVGNLVTVGVGTGGNVSLSNALGAVHVIADIVGYYGFAGDSRLTPLVPARILDTRGATGGHPGAFGPGASFDLQVTGQGGVPASGVSGVVMNITAVGPTATSWLTAWPTGVTMPLAASVNFGGGQTLGNLVKVKLGTGGKVSLSNANGAVHVVADVVGYYGTTGDSVLTPVLPARILDTRGALGGHPGAVGPGQSFDVQVAGQGGVPDPGATAVVVNITAVSPSAGSFVTVWPSGLGMPLASTTNFAAGQTIGHLAVLKIGANGKISLFNANGFVHLVADVVGYYTSP